MNERRNVCLVGLMQYLNFGLKYDVAAVTGDLFRFLSKKSVIQQDNQL